ncbi:MAG TPA: cysteine desulfurase [Deinococcales bacterium]|nr:cysteine desulfurase [Deinococcales bacterium]
MTSPASSDTLLRDFAAYRQDFPILSRPMNGQPLVYLDSAATSQKPEPVLKAMDDYYREINANVHRGAYQLSVAATEAYEGARAILARFINAPDPSEVIFTRNTSEGINLVAYAWGLKELREGDEIVVTELEHHSNLVPWHIVAGYRGAKVKAVKATPDGRLDLDSYAGLLKSGRVRMVAVGHVCNALGTINPVARMARMAHEAGALILVDGAQAAPHLPVDVQALGVDFYAVSGHKMCGPTGSGVLWGRREVLKGMNPFMGGGEMIREVTTEWSTYADLPNKFEAGTPAIAEAIGLGAAADYLLKIGLDRVHAHETALLSAALERVRALPTVVRFGPEGEDRAGVLAFNIKGIHGHDVATFLDQDGVCIRAGHHCAQPSMKVIGEGSTARASFYLYNTLEDVDRFAASLARCAEFFADFA